VEFPEDGAALVHSAASENVATTPPPKYVRKATAGPSPLETVSPRAALAPGEITPSTSDAATSPRSTVTAEATGKTVGEGSWPTTPRPARVSAIPRPNRPTTLIHWGDRQEQQARAGPGLHHVTHVVRAEPADPPLAGEFLDLLEGGLGAVLVEAGLDVDVEDVVAQSFPAGA
jgi:hypothetical protein